MLLLVQVDLKLRFEKQSFREILFTWWNMPWYWGGSQCSIKFRKIGFVYTSHISIVSHFMMKNVTLNLSTNSNTSDATIELTSNILWKCKRWKLRHRCKIWKAQGHRKYVCFWKFTVLLLHCLFSWVSLLEINTYLPIENFDRNLKIWLNNENFVEYWNLECHWCLWLVSTPAPYETNWLCFISIVLVISLLVESIKSWVKCSVNFTFHSTLMMRKVKSENETRNFISLLSSDPASSSCSCFLHFIRTYFTVFICWIIKVCTLWHTEDFTAVDKKYALS